ncbi:hypothetical protein [Reyranella sp.]|uniref:hypothetical protein n=1 Tax=Reyranella sp. TaxID=1929291 RepID=UPI003D099AD3
MLTLAQYLETNALPPSEFAARLSKRLNRPVSQQNVYRWTRPMDHDEFSIPSPFAVVAIEQETGGAVAPASWYQHAARQLRLARRRRVA